MGSEDYGHGWCGSRKIVVLFHLGFTGDPQIEGYTAITITQILSTDCVRVSPKRGETEREEEVGGSARLMYETF